MKMIATGMKQKERRNCCVRGTKSWRAILLSALLFCGVSEGAAAPSGWTDGGVASVKNATLWQSTLPLMMADNNAPSVTLTPNYLSGTVTASSSDPGTIRFFYTINGETPVVTLEDDEPSAGNDTYEAINGIIDVEDEATSLTVIAVRLDEVNNELTLSQSESVTMTIERYASPTASANWNSVSNHTITVVDPNSDDASTIVRYDIESLPSSASSLVSGGTVAVTRYYANYYFRVFGNNKFPSLGSLPLYTNRWNIPVIENYVPFTAATSTSEAVPASGRFVGNAEAYVYINYSHMSGDTLADPGPTTYDAVYAYADNPTIPEGFTAGAFKMVAANAPSAEGVTVFPSPVMTVTRNYSGYFVIQMTDNEAHHYLCLDSNLLTPQVLTKELFDRSSLWSLDDEYNLYQTVGGTNYYLGYNPSTQSVSVTTSASMSNWFVDPTSHTLRGYNGLLMTYTAHGWRMTAESNSVPVLYEVSKRVAPSGQFDEITSFSLDPIACEGRNPQWLAMADGDTPCSLSVTPHVTVTTFALPEHIHYSYSDASGNIPDFTFFERNNRSYQSHQHLPYRQVSSTNNTIYDTNITYTWHLTFDEAEGSGLAFGNPATNSFGVASNLLSRNGTVTGPQRAIVTVEATYTIHNTTNGVTTAVSQTATTTPLAVYAEQKAANLKVSDNVNQPIAFTPGKVYMLSNYLSKDAPYSQRYYVTGDNLHNYPYLTQSAHAERVFHVTRSNDGYYRLYNDVLGLSLSNNAGGNLFESDNTAVVYSSDTEGDDHIRQFILTPYQDGENTYFTLHSYQVNDSCSLVLAGGDEGLEGATLRLMNTHSSEYPYSQPGVAPEMHTFDEGYFTTARWQLVIPTLLPPVVHMNAEGLVTLTDSIGSLRNIPTTIYYQTRTAATTAWSDTLAYTSTTQIQLVAGNELRAWTVGASDGNDDYSYMHQSDYVLFTAHQVATPTISSNGNIITFSDPDCTDDYIVDAVIHYTIDGESDPGAAPTSNGNAIRYSGSSDTMSHAATITFRAYAPDCIMSEVGTYSHSAVLPLAIVLGTDSNSVMLEMTDENVTSDRYVIYYTTDGNDPVYDVEMSNIVGQPYQGDPITFSSFTILKAKAFPSTEGNGYSASPVLHYYHQGQYFSFTYVDPDGTDEEAYNMMLLDNTMLASNSHTIDNSFLWLAPTALHSTTSRVFNEATSTFLTFDENLQPYGTNNASDAKLWQWGGEPNYAGATVANNNYYLYTTEGGITYYLAFDKQQQQWTVTTSTANTDLELAVAYRTDTINYPGGEEFSPKGVNLFLQQQGSDQWVSLDTTSAWLAMRQGQTASLRASLKGQQIHYESNVDINIHKYGNDVGEDEHDYDNYVPWQQWHQKDGYYCHHFFEVPGYQVINLDDVLPDGSTITWALTSDGSSPANNYFSITSGSTDSLITLTRTNTTSNSPILDIRLDVHYLHSSVYANLGESFNHTVPLHLYAETEVGFNPDSLYLSKRFRNHLTGRFLAVDPDSRVTAQVTPYAYLTDEPLVTTAQDYSRYAVWRVRRVRNADESGIPNRFRFSNLAYPNDSAYRRPDNQGGLYLLNPSSDAMFNYLHLPTHPANPLLGDNSQYMNFSMHKFVYGVNGNDSLVYVTIAPYGGSNTYALNANNSWQSAAYGSDHITGGAESYWSSRWIWERAQLTPPIISMNPSGQVTMTHHLQTSPDLTETELNHINNDGWLKFYYTFDGSDPATSSSRHLWDPAVPISLVEGDVIKAVSVLTNTVTGYEAQTSSFQRTFEALRTATPAPNGTDIVATEGDSIVIGVNQNMNTVHWNSCGENIIRINQSRFSTEDYGIHTHESDVLEVVAYRHNELESHPYFYSQHQALTLSVSNVEVNGSTATVTFHIMGSAANGLPPQSAYYKIFYTSTSGTEEPTNPTASSSCLIPTGDQFNQTLTLTVSTTDVTHLKAVALPVEGFDYYTGSAVVSQYIIPSSYTGSLSGSGTQADPYLVSNAVDLMTVANSSSYWGSGVYLKVTNDIDLTGIQVPSIGGAYVDQGNQTQSNSFEGNWDGNYKVISHATNPLFKQCSNAHVYNVVIANSDISTESGYCGGICAVAFGNSRIYNSGVRGTSSVHGKATSSSATGGIVGCLYNNSRVVNCYNFATVKSSGSNAGGIAGLQENASNYDNPQGIVFGCMNYGDVISVNSKAAPVLSGDTYTQSTYTNNEKGFNTYNYFRLNINLTGSITYNCALPIEERFLTRFEPYRTVLNANLKKAGWWIDGTFSEENAGGATMGKWVLVDTIAPYPIVLPKYSETETISYVGDGSVTITRPKAIAYPSFINPNYADEARATDSLPFRGKRLGSLSVTVNSGSPISSIMASGATFPSLTSIPSMPLSLPITDMDTTHYDYNYYKVQLPYFQDIFGVGSCVQTVGGQDYIVTGWDITAVTGDPSVTYNNFILAEHNYADRYSIDKDLFSTSGRVFAQGGYYNVPEGVTAITISAHWGKAIYLSETTNDAAYASNYSVNQLTLYGSAGNTLFGKSKTVCNIRDAVKAKISSVPSVYDQAIVLLSDYHYCSGGDGDEFFKFVDNNQMTYYPFTVTTVDEDNDHEPDHCFFQSYKQRRAINPIRFDFVYNLGMSVAGIVSNSLYTTSIALPSGHFEITETAFAYYGQFEYDINTSNGKAKQSGSPLILQNGAFDQIISSQKNDANRTGYIHLGGHVWFKMFSPGTHGDGTIKTAHCPVTVTGGEYQEFYLSGMFNANASVNADSPRFYANGGRFGEYASGGQEQINGSVTVLADHIISNEFYGGGINPAKPITGDVNITLNNSIIGLYAGGPKFGDMASGKVVTTTANNTTFGTYYGAGYGGTGLSLLRHSNATAALPWSSEMARYVKGRYYTGTVGIDVDYKFEFMPLSGGYGKHVGRFYVYRANLSKATAHNVTSDLSGCVVLNDFYGAGYVGSVDGTATSTLDSCTIYGNAYAGGNSSTVPKVLVYDPLTVWPSFNGTTGVYTIPEKPEPEEYTWTYKSSGYTNNSSQIDATNKLIYTNQSLDDIGQANVTDLTIKGNTVVYGSVFGGGNLAKVNGGTTLTIGEDVAYDASTIANHRPYIHRNVYGGGNVADVGSSNSNATVNIYTGYMRSIYGGGNQGSILGSTQVNLMGGYVGYTPTVTVTEGDTVIDYATPAAIQPQVGRDRMFFGVYGGGFGLGTTVCGHSNMTIGRSADMRDNVAVYGSVYGGGEAGQVGGGYMLSKFNEGATLTSNHYYYDFDDFTFKAATAGDEPVEGTDYYTFVAPTFNQNTTQVTVLTDESKTTNILGAVYGGGRGYYMALENDMRATGTEVDFHSPIAGAVYGNTQVTIGTAAQDSTRLKIGSLRFFTKFEVAEDYGLVDQHVITASPMAPMDENLFVYDLDNLNYVPLTTGQSTAVNVRAMTKTNGAKTVNISAEMLDDEVQYFMPTGRVSVAGGGESGGVYGSTIFGSNNIFADNSDRYNTTGGNTAVTIHSGTLGDVLDSVVSGDVYGAGLKASIDGVSSVLIDGSTTWVRGDVYAGGCMGTNYAYNRASSAEPIYVSQATVTGGWLRNLHAGSNLVELPANGNSKLIFGTMDDDNDILMVSESIYGGSGLAAMNGTTEVVMNSGRVGYVRKGVPINSLKEKVTLAEGNAGDIVVNTNNVLSYEGNVYGGGYGPKAAVKRSKVTVNGGVIRNGVYGGGELAPVGDIAESGTSIYQYYTYSTHGTDSIVNTYYNEQEGNVTDIVINDGQMSAVCGGGRGYSKFLNVASHMPGTILGNTSVYIGGGTIDATNYGSDLGGGNIYGGGLEGEVTGNTRVTIAGGTIDGHVFAGGRGYSNSMLQVLEEGQAYDDILDRASRRAGWVMGNTSLTVKDSNADVKPTITYGVYGGGEGMNYVTHIGGYTRYDTVAAVHGNAVVNITGGTIGGGHSYGKNPDHGSYAGGRVASIHGYADMLVSGSANVAAVYGGNDVSGMIIGYGRNTTNQSGGTLTQDDTRTYVCITGTPTVGHVFGGGNGQYPYYNDVVYAQLHLTKPTQTATYVDIKTTGGWLDQVFGGGNSAEVLNAQVYYLGTGLADTIFAGGNSATVSESAMVTVNAAGDAVAVTRSSTPNHINYLFGGNNMATMNILPSLELTRGVLGKVYGGGNAGAMVGNGVRNDFFGQEVRNLSTYVLVNSEYVTIQKALFGGCNNANVARSTFVDIRRTSNEGIAKLFGGNDISENVRTTRVDINGGIISELFGGGNGYYNYTPNYNHWNVTSKEDNSQLVAINSNGRPTVDSTHVNIWGGTVGSSIFGGGYAGDCRITHVVVNDTANWNMPTSIERTEGSISGMIFGGGYGDLTLLGSSEPHVGNVTTIARTDLYHVTHLGEAYSYGGGKAGDVVDAVTNVHPDWNQPLAALYGGCYGSDVTGTATVNLRCVPPADGGLNVTTLFGGNDYTGTVNASVVNVYNGRYGRMFGAGNGVYEYSDGITSPNSKYPTVNFYNGTMTGNLYGGGDQGKCFVGDTNIAHATADDYAHVVLNIHGGRFMRDIFAGASGNENAPHQLIYGLKQLNMDGGVVDNSIYGGSESVRDGYPSECDSTNTTLRPSSILNITGGDVLNNVYGGGYLGQVYGSVFVNVGKDAVDKSPVWSNSYNGTTNAYMSFKPEFVTDSLSAVGPKLMKRNLYLEASVYNGANWGEAGSSVFFNTPGFFGGESRIYVDGQGYNTTLSTSGTSMPAMDIHYSLIGAGTSCEGGDHLRHILVRNYGEYNDCQASKELFSIQRADSVRLQNTAIKFVGDQDALSAYPSTRYAVNRVGYLRLQGFNVMEIDVPIARTGHLQFLTADGQILTASSTEALTTMRSGVTGMDCSSDACSRLASAVNPSTRPYSILLVNNGVGVDIADENGVSGAMEGYGFLLSQSGYRAVVTARPKSSSSATDGGFFSCCDENTYTEDGAFSGGEFKFVNNSSSDPTYRSWKSDADSADHVLRKLTIVAHSDATKLDHNKLFNTDLTDDNSQPIHFGLAKGSIELPSTMAGHYYTIDGGIHVDQDNNEMTLVNGAFNPSNFDETVFDDNHPDARVDGAWKVLNVNGVTSESVQSEINNDPSRKFGLLMTAGSHFAPDASNASTTAVLAGNDIYAGSYGGFRTASVQTADAEVIPVLDFYLTYSTNFATTTFGEVTFTLTERDPEGHVVGNVDVNVTLTTIIEEFRDQKYDLVAMHNDFGKNEYTRKLVLPASMQRRNLYLTSVQWEPCTTAVSIGGHSYAATGITNNNINFSLTDSNGTRNQTTFALKVVPTEHISQSLTTTLGWYNITDPTLDIFGDAELTGSASYSGNNAATPIALDGADLTVLSHLDEDGGTASQNYSGSRGRLVGVLDGRSSAAIDLSLLFDGDIMYEPTLDGCRGVAVLGFDYWNGNTRQGHFDVTVYIRTRSKGDTIYLASAHELQRMATVGEETSTYTLTASTNTNDQDRGKKPSTYIQSLSVAFLGGIYQAGDVLCILDTLNITDNQSLHGLDYNYIPVVRYEGHHHEYPGRDCAYRGSMIKLSNGGKLTADNMVFDGSMVSHYQSGPDSEYPNNDDIDTLKASGPIFEVAEGGTLILGNNTIVQNNYNQCDRAQSGSWGGAISVTGANSLLRLDNAVTIQNNLVPDSNGFASGAIHVDGGTVLLGTVKSGTSVQIAENYKVSSRADFMDDDHQLSLPVNKAPANVFLTRKPLVSDSNNPLIDGQSDMILFESPLASTSRIGITKEFPGITARDTIRIARVSGSHQQYAQRAFANGNFFNDGTDGKVFYNSTISPLTIYFQRCATFLKQLYGQGELAGNNPLNYIVLREDIPTIESMGYQQPVMAYKWNMHAACPDETDSLVYRVHGGFYPYTYSWSWGNSTDDMSVFRTFTTPYPNDSINFDIANGDATKATLSNEDIAELHGMLLNNGQGGTFYYSVTATDLAGCQQTQKVLVEMTRNHNPAGITLVDPISLEDDALKYAWNDTSSTSSLAATRNFRGIHLIAQVQPKISWGTVSGILENTNSEVTLAAEEDGGTLLCPGEAVRLHATAADNIHRFIQWDFDPYDEDNTVFVMPHDTGDVSINAYFGPNQYWKDVVTDMPGGVTYEYDGDVIISSPKGLAWLISLANGLNGQQIRDFYFDTVHVAAGTYDMSQYLWTPLSNSQHRFRGVLNVAEGASISGIIVNEPRMDHVGFFAYLDDATVDGLNITKSLFHGSQYVGGIAAEANNSTIANSSVADSDGEDVTIITANYASGGLVGIASNSTMIDNCSATAKYMGATIYNGGVLGYGDNVQVTNTYSWTRTRMSALYSGGAVGYITGSNTGSKSRTGSYLANNYVRFDNPYGQLNRVGGLVGYARNSTLENNYVYGSTSGGRLTGALGSVLDGGVTVSNCYFEQGSNSDAFGHIGGSNSTTGVTSFNGAGNQVIMTERVGSTNNLTLALNRWVRDHSDEGFATWRSDLEGRNHGYPQFGRPDLIPVYENLSYEVCDSLTLAGQLFTSSGVYQYHVVDSADFVDSTITLSLTINYSSLTQFEDTVLQGEDYQSHGFNLSATEIDLLREAAQQGEVVTIVISDTLQSMHGCDSIVTLYLTVGNGGGDQPIGQYDVKVYPNPTAGLVSVETDEMLLVELYDGISRCLLRRTVEGNSCQLDLSNYPSGMYYLRVKSVNGTLIKKIIKQ